MEGGRDCGAGAAAAAAGQERRRRWRGAGCGGDDEERESSDGSSGVELSLRLRTGAPGGDDDDGAASAPPPLPLPLPPAAAEARRNMTIFYNGRVCAVDVTEVQARAIISMASEETLAADHHRRQRQQLMRGDDDNGRRRQQDGDGDSSSTKAVARRCARGSDLVRPAAPAAVVPSPLLAAGGVVGSHGQALAGAVAAPVVDQVATGRLSMKRSLQLFLQKRKARTAAAVAPPYAGGGRQAQAVRR